MNYSKGMAMCGAILLASTAIVTIATPVDARKRPVVVTAPSTDTVIRKVSYRDLNLASLPDQKILRTRVGGAVKGVCDDIFGPNGDLIMEIACRNAAWNGARPQIARAVLRAQQIASTGHSLIAVSAITLNFGQ